MLQCSVTAHAINFAAEFGGRAQRRERGGGGAEREEAAWADIDAKEFGRFRAQVLVGCVVRLPVLAAAAAASAAAAAACSNASAT